MAIIVLTKDAMAVIDDEDYKRISKYKWHLTGDGKYAARRQTLTKGVSRILYMHHAVLNIEPDITKPVDHLNGDGLDNRKANLQQVTPQTNILRRGVKATGVAFDSTHCTFKAYYDKIIPGQPKRRINIGTFATREAATTARNAWIQENVK